MLQVSDTQGRPIRKLHIGIKGDAGSAVTDDAGKARIKLAKDTKPNSLVFLQILTSPPGTDLAILSPYDRYYPVPPFENESANFVPVVVVRRKDRAALESGFALRSMTAQINNANVLGASEPITQDPRNGLAQVAKEYGLDPDELDRQIRTWGAKTTDPYEVGLAELYARNYPRATTQLEDSLRMREGKLVADQKGVAADRQAVAEAAFFLGQSLYNQGRYKESAAAFQRCLQIRPDDPKVLNNAALSMAEAGDSVGAEKLYRIAISIAPKYTRPLSNLAALLRDNAVLPLSSEYEEAEALLRQALEIDQKSAGGDRKIGEDLNNLGLLLCQKRDYEGAESAYQQALAIAKKSFGPEAPEVGVVLNNMALLLKVTGDYVQAEHVYRQALETLEKTLDPDHPEIGTVLYNLALVLQEEHDYDRAEPLLERALTIRKNKLGPDHPKVAQVLDKLANSLYMKGDHTGAEQKLQQALAIYEKALGPDSLVTSIVRFRLEDLLKESRAKPEH